MPIYGFQCECGHEKEVMLPFKEYDKPQTCKCGKVMQRQMSVCSFVIKPTGKQMALDTLNDRHNGMPSKHWKNRAEHFAAAGL